MESSRPSGPPNESADITHFGWEIRDNIPIPVIAQSDPAPPGMIDVIQCQCRAQDKKCSTEACACHKQHHHSATVLVMRVVAMHTPHEKMLRLEMMLRLETMVRLEMMLRLEMGEDDAAEDCDVDMVDAEEDDFGGRCGGGRC